MSGLIRTILIMSISGGIVTLLLFALKPLARNRLPKSVQYYLWLVVIAALLVPFSKFLVFEKNDTLPLPVAPIQTTVERTFTAARQSFDNAYTLIPGTGQNKPVQQEPTTEDIALSFGYYALTALSYLYPFGIVIVLLYFAINYSVYTKLHRRRNTAATSDENKMLAELCGGKRTPLLYRNPLTMTPMLIGVFRPAIILPDREYTAEQLRAVLLHELTHMRRKDVLVKWLSVLVTALHWFNPVVWLVRREIDRACELACDEAVIRNLDAEGKQNYGETLLYVAADSKTPHAVLSTTMCEEKKALKERLGAIMKSKKYTLPVIIVSAVLLVFAAAMAVILGAGGFEPKQEDVVSDDPKQEKIDVKDAVLDAIFQHNQGRYGNGMSFAAASAMTLKTTEDSGYITAYIIAYYAEYMNSGHINHTGGGIAPVAVTFVKDTLKVTEYWEAENGSRYLPSIQEKFPEDIWDIIDTQFYAEELEKNCLAQARQYYNSVLTHTVIPDNNSPHSRLVVEVYDGVYLADGRSYKDMYFAEHIPVSQLENEMVEGSADYSKEDPDKLIIYFIVSRPDPGSGALSGPTVTIEYNKENDRIVSISYTSFSNSLGDTYTFELAEENALAAARLFCEAIEFCEEYLANNG